MPTYTLKNVKTGEIKDEIISISEMEEKTKSGDFVQIFSGKRMSIISQHGSTISKTSSDWKDHLKQIKKGSGKDNSINV